MTNPLQQAAQIAGNTARFGWYYGINWLLDRQVERLGGKLPYRPSQPVPTRQELLTDLAGLFLADAKSAREGLFPPNADEADTLTEHLARLRMMLADLPEAVRRRQTADAGTARRSPEADGLPDYFTQDFHFQTGGYLSEESARLYDVQVETLFYGSANAMRRAGLRPIAEFMRGKDQRQAAMLDVACGTGRFLRQVRLAFPAMKLAGLDLSQPYLAEAARHMDSLRPAAFIHGNAEQIPLDDASQDIASCIFMFHELPALVRRRVAAEIARVLKPGGLLVFIDSLQIGDRPGWDGLLEAFPVRFHEPYFRQYTTDDLDGLFADAGLLPIAAEPVFLSKLMVRRKG